jgi:hypothetical protein
MKVADIINTITAQKVLPELCDLDSRSTSSCLARLAVEVAALFDDIDRFDPTLLIADASSPSCTVINFGG